MSGWVSVFRPIRFIRRIPRTVMRRLTTGTTTTATRHMRIPTLILMRTVATMAVITAAIAAMTAIAAAIVVDIAAANVRVGFTATAEVAPEAAGNRVNLGA